LRGAVIIGQSPMFATQDPRRDAVIDVEKASQETRHPFGVDRAPIGPIVDLIWGKVATVEALPRSSGSAEMVCRQICTRERRIPNAAVNTQQAKSASA
jgi:hypothetical protein